MNTIGKRLAGVAVVSSALLLAGCFFENTASVTTIPGEGVLSVDVNFSGNWLNCLPAVSPGVGGGVQTYSCAFFEPGKVSSFELSPVELLLFAFLVDPLVIQLPTAVSGVSGTFAHAAGNGSLVVQGPLASVPVDAARTLTAEPGTRLYIVSVPEAFETAHPTGEYAFSLHLNAPLGTTNIPVKALLTATVRTLGGQTYYPPVFPCVADMAAAPGGIINTAVPASTFTLPAAASIPGCQGARFSFAAGDGVTAVPTLGPWAFAALALLLAGAAVARTRRRTVATSPRRGRSS